MNRIDHYREAERLAERAKNIAEEYVTLAPEETKRKIDLEMLARQLTDRGLIHAQLACVPVEVAREAITSELLSASS